MLGLEVRRAHVRDLVEILALERATVGWQGWSDAVWREVLAAAEAVRVVLVAEVDGELVGFVVGGRAADVVEIESVVVAEGARRRGVARALCGECILWARAIGAERMELEVRASNAGARKLYERLGFAEQGRRRGYYRAPEEDAVLMGVSLGMSGEGAKV